MTKVVAIVQSSYVPWKGYFDLIGRADEFIFLDDAQYTKRDWRNRNRIKTAAGTRWLTIPVNAKGSQQKATPICEVTTATSEWAGSHWSIVRQAYREAPQFDEYEIPLQRLFEAASGKARLSEINRSFIAGLMDLLGIRTRLSWSMDYDCAGQRTEKLLSLCRAASATTYLAGPRSRNYLEEDAFRVAGIDVEYMDYSGYPEYPQLHGPFDHHVSVIDLLLTEGKAAARSMGAAHWRQPPRVGLP